MNAKRLLNVAKALRESPAPDQFTMGQYAHRCGTPACALGHYAARHDLQGQFVLHQGHDGIFCVGADDDDVPYHDRRVLHHFGIDGEDAERLFGPTGCGSAKTPIKAAEYIERFVEQNS